MTAIARPEAPGDVDTEPPSFDELYAAHYGDLTVQLYAYFGDRQEAQDVVQEAFCRAYARWRTISPMDAVKTCWSTACSGMSQAI